MPDKDIDGNVELRLQREKMTNNKITYFNNYN